jgi:hypothetical protein
MAVCVPVLLGSSESQQVSPLLEAVLKHKSNPYWLVKVINDFFSEKWVLIFSLKVRLLELISELQFTTLAYVLGDNLMQRKFLDGIVMHLVGDEDVRVRAAATSTLKKYVML